MDVPIACTLTESQMRERRETVLNSIRKSALEVTSLPNGFAYRFEPASDVLTALSQMVDLERKCCPFLAFTIVVESGGGPIRLEITGPTEAKTMIANFFG